MKKIGILANPIVHASAGVRKYSHYLLEKMLSQDKDNEYILFADFFKDYKKRKKQLEDFVKKTGNKKTSIYISRFPNGWKEWLISKSFPQKLFYRRSVDVFFALFPTGIAKNGFKKQVVTIHDLAFKIFPSHQGQKLSDYYFKRTQIAVEQSQKIICDSDSTKKDLLKFFNINPDKTETVYLGVDNDLYNVKSTGSCKTYLQKYKISQPYILSVCTLEPRKNLESLLDAYILLPQKMRKEVSLVLVGESGWNNERLLAKIESLSRKGEKIIRTGYLPEEALPFLYSAAEVFIYPSLYEGFGLPPLEAMACGCPVITSNNSSLPEVVGDAGLLIDPKSKEKLSIAIQKVVNSKNLKRDMILKGLEQSKKFSWEKAAQKTIEILETLD